MPSILCLLVVWLGVFLCLRLISSGKPTAAATLELLRAKPGAAEGAERRHAWIALMSSRLAVLDLDSRHRTLMDSRLRSAFLDLSPEDQALFLKSIETPGQREFVEGSKGWSAGRYERLLQPALADLEELKTGSTAQFEALLADSSKWKIATSGLISVLKDESLLTRFDAQPLIERIQIHSQMGR